MKTLRTISDAGALSIGTYENRTLYKNLYGDGVNTAYLFEDSEEAAGMIYDQNNKFELLGFYECINGFIFDYDCSSGAPIEALNGVYCIYLQLNVTSNIFVIERLGDTDLQPSEDTLLLQAQEEEIKELYAELEALKKQIKWNLEPRKN